MGKMAKNSTKLAILLSFNTLGFSFLNLLFYSFFFHKNKFFPLFFYLFFTKKY